MECASVGTRRHFMFFMYIQLMGNLKSYRPVYKIQILRFNSPDNSLVSFSKWGVPPSKKVNSEKCGKLKSCDV